jgi:hypothetical protein
LLLMKALANASSANLNTTTQVQSHLLCHTAL